MAKAKRIKKKEHEKLTDSNISHVIGLLKAEKPITKKSACDILNIAYNTTRLNTIMENYVSRKEYEKSRKDKNRGKPVTKDETKTIISGYLTGSPIVEIAGLLYRSPGFIKAVLNRIGVPEKQTGDEKNEVAILPDECVAMEFKPGQVVWSASYHAPCEIVREVSNSDSVIYEEKYGCKVYKIYILEALDEVNRDFPNVTVGGFHASSPAYDLGSLEHLAEYDIKYSS
jgi:hypothetical protein